MSSLMADLATSSIALAVGRSGKITILRNNFGPRTREAGLRQLALSLTPEDREQLLRELHRMQEISPAG